MRRFELVAGSSRKFCKQAAPKDPLRAQLAALATQLGLGRVASDIAATAADAVGISGKDLAKAAFAKTLVAVID